MLRKTTLKTRMILTLGLLGALQTLLIGGFAGYYLSESLYEEIGQVVSALWPRPRRDPGNPVGPQSPSPAPGGNQQGPFIVTAITTPSASPTPTRTAWATPWPMTMGMTAGGH